MHTAIFTQQSSKQFNQKFNQAQYFARKDHITYKIGLDRKCYLFSDNVTNIVKFVQRHHISGR